MMHNKLDSDPQTPLAKGQTDPHLSREKMTQELYLTQQRFCTALNEIPITLTQQDCALRYLWIHNGDGCPPNEYWIGKTDLEVMERREDGRNLEKLKRRVLETGAGTRSEVSIHKNGVKHYYDLNIQPFYDATGALSGVICALADISEHKRAQENERQQLHLSEALCDIAMILTSTLDLSEVLQRILMNVEQVVPHDAADILLIDKGVAEIARSRGYTQDGVESQTLALRFSVAHTPPLRLMAESRQPLVVADIRTESEWTKLPQEDWQRAYVGIPILIQDKIIGFLTLYSTTPGFFTEQHVRYLQAFAAQAAVAIHNAQMHKNAREVAAAEERYKLASELHDSVNQMLFSSSIIAEALPKLPSSNRQMLNSYLNHLQRLNRGALAEMRMLLTELRPDQPIEVTLSTQLRRLVDAVQGRDEINIGLLIEGDYRLPPDVRHAFYQISQDALDLMIEASNSKQATIHLKSLPGRVELNIRDEQLGIPGVIQMPPLDSLRQHAEAVKADFQVRREEGRGMTISVTWSRAG